MLQRVMPQLMNVGNVLVLNDEAHHCYRERQGEADEAFAELTEVYRIEADFEARVRQAFDRMVEASMERSSAAALTALGGTEPGLDSARRHHAEPHHYLIRPAASRGTFSRASCTLLSCTLDPEEQG